MAFEVLTTSDLTMWQPPLFAPSTWILIISSTALLFGYDRWRRQYFERRGIPSIGAKPFVGHTLDLMFDKRGIIGFYEKLISKSGKITGFYQGWRPALLTADVDMVRQICIKDFATFTNRRVVSLENKPLHRSLSNLCDNHWRDVRSVISPTFSASKMRMITPLINRCLDRMIQKVSRQGNTVKCEEIYGVFLLETACSCALGLDITSADTDNYDFLKDLFKINMSIAFFVFMFAPFLVPVANYFNLSTFKTKTINFFVGLLDRAIEMRKKPENQRMDFLQMMLETGNTAQTAEVERLEQEHCKKTNKKSLTREEIMSQGLAFFLGGFATSGSTLAFASYLLATNPDIQDRLVAEIEKVAPLDSEVNYEAVCKMMYLDQVVREVLRLYPPAAVVSRVAGKDWDYGDMRIEAGTEVFISVWCINRDKELWENPDVFNPDRFSPERKKQQHPCAWLPFGSGPRSCVGMRFALLQVKMCMIHMLQKFRFEACSETEIPPVLGKYGPTGPPNGIKLNAVPR